MPVSVVLPKSSGITPDLDKDLIDFAKKAETAHKNAVQKVIAKTRTARTETTRLRSLNATSYISARDLDSKIEQLERTIDQANGFAEIIGRSNNKDEALKPLHDYVVALSQQQQMLLQYASKRVQ